VLRAGNAHENVDYRHRGGESLEGNAPAQVRVFRDIDDTHAALAELLNNSIMRDGPTVSLGRSPGFFESRNVVANAKKRQGDVICRLSSAHSLAKW
jgi:hypothetical protein